MSSKMGLIPALLSGQLGEETPMQITLAYTMKGAADTAYEVLCAIAMERGEGVGSLQDCVDDQVQGKLREHGEDYRQNPKLDPPEEFFLQSRLRSVEAIESEIRHRVATKIKLVTEPVLLFGEYFPAEAKVDLDQDGNVAWYEMGRKEIRAPFEGIEVFIALSEPLTDREKPIVLKSDICVNRGWHLEVSETHSEWSALAEYGLRIRCEKLEPLP